jgi:hypothetical protein
MAARSVTRSDSAPSTDSPPALTPEIQQVRFRDSINDNLAQLEAMMLLTWGEPCAPGEPQGFRRLSDQHQDAYLWACHGRLEAIRDAWAGLEAMSSRPRAVTRSSEGLIKRIRQCNSSAIERTGELDLPAVRTVLEAALADPGQRAAHLTELADFVAHMVDDGRSTV